MVKKKYIVIVILVVLLIVALAVFVPTTPSIISELKTREPYGISVLEGTIEHGDIVNRNCYITDKEQKDKIIKLITDADFKSYNSSYGGISYSGVAKTYNISIEFVDSSNEDIRSTYRQIYITIANGLIYASIEGKATTFGIDAYNKFDGKSVEFMEQFLNIIEDDLVPMD